ncbi:MAG TPA: inorganic phosphate transporter [Candidatus Saccharimonadales bacterium]|nr:inorganic phosphate transporter [Candidatus Saccharimonadales bacterium]
MILVVLIIIIALVFDFLNGFHDSANSIATVVSTRVLKPQQAVIMAAFANFVAAFFFSTAVASTIGKGIIQPLGISSAVILAGLVGACCWNLITWYLGLPISSSHALIGGLIGAVVVRSGTKALIFAGINKTFLFIVLAPLIGLVGAIIFTLIITILIRNRSHDSLTKVFSKLQIFSSFWYSLGHGANDAQKTMGVISLTLFSNHMLGSKFYVPYWVILLSHAAIAIGTYFGGWRIVRTMGSKIIHLRPFEGFCAETSGAVTLFLTSSFGIPVSTTHVIAGSIMGVGSVKNYKQVKWITTRKIFLAWIVTIPISMIFGMVFSVIFKF